MTDRRVGPIHSPDEPVSHQGSRLHKVSLEDARAHWREFLAWRKTQKAITPTTPLPPDDSPTPGAA